MLLTHSVAGMLSIVLMVLDAGVVFGQDSSAELRTGYPNKSIRIVTTGIQGRADIVARLLAQELTGVFHQPLVIDNRANNLGADIVAKAAPDGYTLLAEGASVWIATLSQKKSYDPVRDFSPITMVEAFPFVLVVNSSVPVNSVSELIALAKARPGGLNYASGSPGSGNHLGGELFKAMAGVNIVWIAYSGIGPAINAVLNGEVHLLLASAAAAAPHVKSGKLRALAVTSLQPSALAPGLPTVAASGVPGYELVSITGMLAPAGTPPAVVNQLNREIVRVLNRTDVKEKYLNVGAEVVGNSPAQFAAIIKSDLAKWGKVIKEAGIRSE